MIEADSPEKRFKRARFDEMIPVVEPVKPVVQGNIPSLLQLNVDAPPDIEIDLDDLRSDEESDSNHSQQNGRSRERSRERDGRTSREERDRSGGRVTRWSSRRN